MVVFWLYCAQIAYSIRHRYSQVKSELPIQLFQSKKTHLYQKNYNFINSIKYVFHVFKNLYRKLSVKILMTMIEVNDNSFNDWENRSLMVVIYDGPLCLSSKWLFAAFKSLPQSHMRHMLPTMGKIFPRVPLLISSSGGILLRRCQISVVPKYHRDIKGAGRIPLLMPGPLQGPQIYEVKYKYKILQ